MDTSAEVITAVLKPENKVKIHPIAFNLDPRLNMISTKLHMGAELQMQTLENHCSGVLLFALIRHVLPSKSPSSLQPHCTSMFHIFPSLSLLSRF